MRVKVVMKNRINGKFCLGMIECYLIGGDDRKVLGILWMDRINHAWQKYKWKSCALSDFEEILLTTFKERTVRE